MFSHYIDLLPFILGSIIVVLGSGVMSFKKPITILVVVAAGVFLLAQSSWFTAWMSGDVWGRDWANYVWFMFNTLTMVIFSWTLIKSR